MFIKRCWLLCCFIAFLLPVSAQEFITLNWQELSSAQTLPIVTRELLWERLSLLHLSGGNRVS
jgi:hypothetical protein